LSLERVDVVQLPVEPARCPHVQPPDQCEDANDQRDSNHGAGGGQQDGIRSSVGLAIGGDYLATAAGIDHLVAEFGVTRQDAPVDRTGRNGEIAVAAQ